MKKVLVTGASGFIGRHTLMTLRKQGFEVHAVSRGRTLEVAGVKWHRSDLLQHDNPTKLVASIKPTHLLHLAWYSVSGKYWTSSENLAWVQSSLELFRAFASHGGRRFVAVGSCAEYQWGQHSAYLEFGTPLKPITRYGACKHALQTALSELAPAVGVSLAWGRIFFVYGPHESKSRLVPAVISSLLRGEPALCTNGEQVRDFLFVEDVADALVAMLESTVVGPVNIGSGEPVKLRDLIIALGTKLRQPELINLGALTAPTDEPATLVANTDRLNREVGWHPQHLLAQGLDKAISWWRSEIRGDLPDVVGIKKSP